MKVDFAPLIFWSLVYGVMWALKLRPNNRISRAAFTWFGPHEEIGESRALFQLRRLWYSFGWLCSAAAHVER